MAKPITQSRSDVLIIGAGVIGAATAYWLTELAPRLKVTLIERDAGFAQASSQRSASSIRQQFATRVNVQMSQFGLQFLREAPERLAGPDGPIQLQLTTPGYLSLYTAAQAAGARARHALQTAAGADIQLLTAPELAQRFAWLNTADLALGAWGEGCEGWFDGPALHRALLARARQQGAVLQAGTVAALCCNPPRARAPRRAVGVVLSDGQRLAADQVILAAGAWARPLAASAGIDLPVHARRRTVFVWSCPRPPQPCPLVIDPIGFWFRPEGERLIGGTQPDPDLDDLPLEPNINEFDEGLWQAMATRVPAFEALRVEGAWAGYYEMNLWDHNALLGPHPALRNLLFGVGFSGHGMQHAPAVGRGLAEWALHGRWQSLDLSELTIDRLVTNRRVLETEVIG